MIGLEYILSLYNMQHIELAERLGIKKQNINLWIKRKQNIPKKYLPILTELFGIEEEYFIKELTEVEKLEIQKEKLKKDLKPIITNHEQQFMIGDVNDIVEVPVYDKEEMNTIERNIEKAKLVSRFKQAIEMVDDNPNLDTFKLIVELLEKSQHEVILHKTIEALAHYLEVLPDWVSTGPEQDEFESDLFEVLDDNNY
ncbi:helix-turn-helix domain-containing protein [Metabacillus rhizolycopersici]|uniref:Helix-turn-helix domain-containing protein n=1 Tax=Metabacillus rhizolycopersici TaxID=2875709 RepID=A0ABS7UV46_9BACI|nr:helix-turn-helix domain-containing protein [Metabacillus rhizolycopersici]MBZ5752180.1 helix-turn-helix domain-containing protein [Metabacillus rhizolycopersici]